MKQFIHIVCIVSCFLIYKNVQSEPIITFFMRPYPIDETFGKEIAHKFQKPGKLAKQQYYGFNKDTFVVGIFSSYAGYLNASDANGQTMFPLHHEAPSVPIIITNKITPIMMGGLTIHHWELEDGTAAKMFNLIRETDPETQISYWDCQEAPLPANKIIPTTTLIVFAEPRYIEIPTGISPTVAGPQLILPPIYTKRGIDTINTALYLLNIKQFFGPLQSLYKVQPKQYSQLVVP